MLAVGSGVWSFRAEGAEEVAAKSLHLLQTVASLQMPFVVAAKTSKAASRQATQRAFQALGSLRTGCAAPSRFATARHTLIRVLPPPLRGLTLSGSDLLAEMNARPL